MSVLRTLKFQSEIVKRFLILQVPASRHRLVVAPQEFNPALAAFRQGDSSRDSRNRSPASLFILDMRHTFEMFDKSRGENAKTMEITYTCH